MFRFIADAVRAKGLVRTIDEFTDAAKQAFKDQEVHIEHVAWVHDYTAWLRGRCVGTYEHIKTARYFVFGLRETDHCPVFWYKPHAGHEHLYPTVKDSVTRMPCYDMVDGVKMYKTDMSGIEVFDGEVEDDLGVPGVQDFSSDRLEVEHIKETMTQIMEMHPTLFGSAAKEWWDAWTATVPRTVEAAQLAHPTTFTWPAKAGDWHPPTLEGLRSEYQETITYLNTVGGQAFSIQNARQAAVEENDNRPEVNAGDLLVLKPGSDDGMHKLPFWVAEVAEKASTADDEVQIIWRSAFKGGYARDVVDGQWLQICKGCIEGRGGIVRYHPYTSKCRTGSRDKNGHGQMKASIQRNQVALYFAKLTKANSHMCAALNH